MTLRKVLEQTAGGPEALAEAKARRQALKLLDTALAQAGITLEQLARKLGQPEAKVEQVLSGQDEITLTTLAAYLHTLGYKLTLAADPDQTAD